MRVDDWNAAGLSTTSDIPLPDWTPELSLAYMDKFDIAGAILSLSSPGVPFGDLAKARSMARQVRKGQVLHVHILATSVHTLQPFGKGQSLTSLSRASVMCIAFRSSAVLWAEGIAWCPVSQQSAVQVNEYTAKLVSQHPDRFGFFAFLPMPDLNASIDEAKYALDTLKADGVVLLGNARGRYFSEKEFHPLLEELNRRKTVRHRLP